MKNETIFDFLIFSFKFDCLNAENRNCLWKQHIFQNLQLNAQKYVQILPDV